MKVTIESFLRQGIKLTKQGKLDQAAFLFKKILERYPDEPRTLFSAAVVADMLGQRNYALNLLHRSISADPAFANPHFYLGQLHLHAGRFTEAYQAFRNAIMRDIEFSAAYDGIRIASSAMGRSVMGDRADVVFYTGGHPFHGGTMEERGLGGSESALVFMARALSANGFRVRVFCNCDKPGDYDGVYYADLVDFHIYRQQYLIPIFVSSRSMRPFKLALKAQTRILWIHDHTNVTYLEGENPGCLSFDRIFAISRWQLDEWSRHFHIPSDYFYLTRNGADLTIFKPREKRDRNRLVYVSRPNRGLDVLLQLFPQIRQRIPDAELHVYTYQLPDDIMGAQITPLIQQPGVYMRGSLPKTALATELSVARVMLYPCTFYETSCIAAIEAQASGTPVVASTLAALPETVLNDVSGYLIPGDPYTAEFGHHFIETVVNLMNDDEAWERLSRGARHRTESLYDWNAIAKDWLEEFYRLARQKNK
ncbi:MAG: glycosyltransferase [Candidatus Brocadiaceae bacterium]|nr:glycosyltransferase [Candidatus Brocadiaceae bacterium]